MLSSASRSVLARALRDAFPYCERIAILRRLALWDLHYGPVQSDGLDSEEAAAWSGFSAACTEIRRWSEGNLPSTVWFDADCGQVSDVEPQGYRDDETDEWIEPFLEETYQIEQREIRRLMFGELAEYV